MNIMNKEFIVNFITRTINSGNADLDEVYKVFIIYCCEEHNKDINLTKNFINILMQVGLLSTYLEEIIDYYKVKYNLIEIKNKENKTILIY